MTGFWNSYYAIVYGDDAQYVIDTKGRVCLELGYNWDFGEFLFWNENLRQKGWAILTDENTGDNLLIGTDGEILIHRAHIIDFGNDYCVFVLNSDGTTDLYDAVSGEKTIENQCDEYAVLPGTDLMCFYNLNEEGIDIQYYYEMTSGTEITVKADEEKSNYAFTQVSEFEGDVEDGTEQPETGKEEAEAHEELKQLGYNYEEDNLKDLDVSTCWSEGVAEMGRTKQFFTLLM